MAIDIDKLSKRNINYTGEKEDWVKEYYYANIDSSLASDNILYSKPNNKDMDKEFLLKSFLYPKYELEFDLDKYTGLNQAVDTVIDVLKREGRILCLSDYDCDGLTSGIVLYRYFKEILGYSNLVLLPNQRKNGNGINKVLLEEIKHMDSTSTHIDLIITSDHASLNEAEVAMLKNENGIDTVITDHHVAPLETRATTVSGFLNPMVEDNVFQGISGCHVAFNLCVGIHRKLGKDLKELYRLLPYVGISTVIDQMPLNNIHNRATVLYGVREASKLKDNYLNTLSKLLRLPKLIKDKIISWNLGPFFNSGNRCSTERTISEAFTVPVEQSERLLTYAIQENNRRKSEQREYVQKAIESVYLDYLDLEHTYAIAVVVDSEYGISGPIASQLVEVFNRPSIVFKHNSDNTILLGSCRSAMDIQFLDILKEIQQERPDLVWKAAGHQGACGIEIGANLLEEFRKAVSDKVGKSINYKLTPNTLDVITYIKPTNITASLALQVESLFPFGNKWKYPIFITKAKFKHSFNYGSSKLMVFYRIGNSTFSGVYSFSRDNGITASNWEEKIKPDSTYYIVFTTVIGYYKNRYTIDTNILDILDVDQVE